MSADAAPRHDVQVDARPLVDAGRVACPTSVRSDAGPFIVQCAIAGGPPGSGPPIDSLGISFENAPRAGNLELAIVAESMGLTTFTGPMSWNEMTSCDALIAGSYAIHLFAKQAGSNETTGPLTFMSRAVGVDADTPNGIAIALFEIESPTGATPEVDRCGPQEDPKQYDSSTTMTASLSPSSPNELALGAALSSLSPQDAEPMIMPGWVVDEWFTNTEQYITLAAGHDEQLVSPPGFVSTMFTFTAQAIYQATIIVLLK